MKRIVFIVGSYYPNYSAVGRCQGNLADEMVKQGYDVTVIAMRTMAEEETKANYNSQHIVRVATRGQFEQLRSKESNNLMRTRLLRLGRVGKAVFSFSSLKKDLLAVYFDALNELSFVPDLIIPTCMPLESIIAALDYKKIHNECQVIPVLYDMFAQSKRLQYFVWNQKLKMHTNMDLERRVFAESDKVLHMPSWTNYAKKNFYESIDKTQEIEHPLVVRPKTNQILNYDRKKINFVYTGVVDKEIRNPEFAINLFQKISKAYDLAVHFYTLGSAEQIIEEYAQKDTCIVAHGQVDSQTAHSAMISSDFLISLGNTVSNQFPSKIFEYMSTGKPIIHFVQTPDDPAINILDTYPMALCIYQASGINEEQLKMVMNFIKETNGKTISFEQVRSLFKNASPVLISSMIAESAMRGG